VDDLIWLWAFVCPNDEQYIKDSGCAPNPVAPEWAGRNSSWGGIRSSAKCPSWRVIGRRADWFCWFPCSGL